MSKEPAWDELEKLTVETLTLGLGESRAAASERLLRAVAKLAESAQKSPGFRKLALEVADATHAAHSVTFEEVCLPSAIETDTPAARVEEFHVGTVRTQLQAWMDEHPGTVEGTVASLRQIGGVIWIELRMPVPESREAPAALSAPVSGVSLQENYQTSDRTWVRRARLELLLPSFQAYRIRYAGRSFLIPAGDVDSVLSGTGDAVALNGVEHVELSSLLELPSEWKHGATPKSLLVRFRGRACLIGVEDVAGPEPQYARNVEDAGPDFRGIAGVAYLGDGTRAAVLDLYPWLETFVDRARESGTVAEREKSEGRYLIFRASGRRYAVPVDRVKSMGRVEGDALLMGMVETGSGAFHLRDVKSMLGLEGEAGRVYVALASRQGTVAWAVDGIEKAPATGSAEVVELRALKFGSGSWIGSGNGLVRGVLSSNPSAPVYVLDVDKLFTSSRSPRRQRMRSSA